jgi:DNA repair protein RecO (recombination protein O)
MYLGLYAGELVGRLVEEHDPHPELFDRLEGTLGELATPRHEATFLAFELDLLRETGYLAELSSCTSCGHPVNDREPCYFSPSRGGVICRNCEGAVHDRMPFDARLVRLLQTILRLPRANGSARRLPQLTRHQTDPVNRLFADQIEHTLGRRLQLAPYVLARNGTASAAPR